MALPDADPESFQTRVAAVRLKLRPGMLFSRRTAAALLGIPAPAPDLIDVAAIRPRRPPERPQVRGHQLGSQTLIRLPDPPAWLPEYVDAWATLAAVCSVDELVMAGDFLVSGSSRWDEPHCSIADLRAAVRRFRGCVGVTKLGAAVELIRSGVESPAETLTRLTIIRSGLPEPRTCCPVPVSGRVLHSDLGYPRLKIAIEYEGEYHFSGGVEQARRDLARAEAMRDAGWRVLYLTALDLRDPREFLARLAREIRAAATRNPRGKLR